MNVLVDTDVVIDYLDGNRDVVVVFQSPELDLYCGSVTVGEVCASRSLGGSQKRATRIALRKVLRVIGYRDPTITAAYDILRSKYASRGLGRGDALIAATAVAKQMPLWTKNRRHFERVNELTLFDPTDWQREHQRSRE